MERWCPRCEWRGNAEGQACPSCGTPLIALTPPEPDLGAYEPAEPPQPLKAPATPGPVRKGVPDPARQPEQEGIQDETPSGGPSSIWRRSLQVAWTILPLAVVGAIVASIVSTNEPTGGAKTTALPTSPSPSEEPQQPPVLVALSGGQGSGGLFASLNGREQDLSSIEPGDLPIVDFELGPTGTIGAIDRQGDLHLLPGGRVVNGPVLEVAFSPDGRSLALCRGGAGPPQFTVATMEHPNQPIWPPVSGCEPMWSTDSNFIAFRMPSGAETSGKYLADEFGVLDVRVDLQFRLAGSWPVAWAPSFGYANTPLTVISAERDSVDIMDPSGGRRRALVTSEMVARLTGGRSFGPIELLAWSPDGELLAIGSASGANGFGLAGIARLDPATGQGTFAGSAYNPFSLSWSSTQAIIAEFAGRAGRTTRLMPKDAPYLDLLDLDQASWSPDGRWILGRSTEGWVTIDALRADRWNAIPAPTSDWVLARWCCPPVPVVRLTGTGTAP